MVRARNSRLRTRALVLVVLAGGCVESSRGCEPGWRSEEDQLVFYEPTVITGAEGYFDNDGPLLVGTVICPRIDCVRPEIEDEDNPPLDLCPTNEDENTSNPALLACFDREVFGATQVGGCLVFDTPGAAVWSFTPRSCDAMSNGFAPLPDEVSFDVIPAEQVTAWFRPDADLWALDNLVAGPGQSFPTDAVREKGDSVKLLADSTVRLPIVLESPYGDVGWQTRQPEGFGANAVASIAVESSSGEPPEVVLTADGAIELVIEDGARAKLRLETDLASFDLGEVVGVAANDIESLELVVGYAETDEAPPSPAGARAILRDETGTPVYGGRVEWEVLEGRLGLGRADLSPEGQPDPNEPDCEYMALAGDCYQQPYRDALVKARLAARFEDLEDVAELEWIVVPGDSEFYDEFTSVFGGVSSSNDAPTTYPCEGPGALGCECNGAPGSMDLTHPMGWLGMATGLLLLRRRRSRKR
jgi:hypothetical protein